MSFKWDDPKKVERYNQADKQRYTSQATPKQIINQPFGFRQEDIIHSLCITVGELIEMAEVQAQSQQKVMDLLKETRDAKTETEVKIQSTTKEEILRQPQRADNGEDHAHST